MRPYLALCRFPAVFTAVADIFLGFALTAGPVFAPRFVFAIAVSAGLYLGGMVLNDLFDIAQDSAERPSRPIPSGRVSRRNAWTFYAALTFGGLFAALSLNWLVLGVALALVAAIWLYDGPLKRTVLGPVLMGLCRTGNILIGASAGIGTLSSISETRVIWIAAAMGLYVCGITWFGREEAAKPGRIGLIGGWVIANLGLATAVAWAGTYQSDAASPASLAALAVIAVIVSYRTSRAIVSPVPANVQHGVRTMLLALPVWNASLIAITGGPAAVPWAVVTGLLLLPALFIGRFLKLT